MFLDNIINDPDTKPYQIPPLTKTPLVRKLQEKIKQILSTDQKKSFAFVYLPEIVSRLEEWKKNLNRIKPFYAIKCNSDPEILRLMANNEDFGFDCASAKEIKQILTLGVDPNRIIFAHPCKPKSDILFAKQNKVKKTTFDSIEELDKISSIYPEAELVLRIKTEDQSSFFPLSTKFGANIADVEKILDHALKLKLNVIGVAFHVGSNCQESSPYIKALENCYNIFEMAKKKDIQMRLIDIGGGFPGAGEEISNTSNKGRFLDFSKDISEKISELFGEGNIEFIAEPGRYFATTTTTLVLEVISKRLVVDENEKKKFQYFIGDGLYGCLNNIALDHCEPRAYLVRKLRSDNEKEVFQSSLFGPTCCSMDCVAKSIMLPELYVGDWLVFYNMGSYTCSIATSFNQCFLEDFYYFSDEKDDILHYQIQK
ncbi:ornithine decarboxylase 1-related [Anaeramoeba ignava]|uniref:ornithine decarboxylase n=1 Tax=Anaeramoeba ignava TaxID=1746090 RepID=A0A9Q0LVA1_ANAIG|nr:ornithine decarboxylase 1-related [Anaeramoeba ignava]